MDGEERDEVRRVVGRRATRDGREVVDGQAKVGGVDRVLANRGGLRGRRVPRVGGRARHLPHVRVARDGDLVEVLGAAYDERMLDRGVARERVGEHGPERGRRDAEDHPARPRGVDERADEVEQRAVGERAADGRERREERVVVWGEEEGEVRVLGCGDVCVRRGRGERAAQRLEQIGGSGGRGGRAISVLGVW